MARKPLIQENSNPLNGNLLFAETPQEQPQEKTQAKKSQGRPKNDNLVRGNSVQEGLTEDYTRATFILKVETLNKLKDYAYTERLSIKDAINEILERALEAEEKKLDKKGEKLLDHKGGK